MSFLEIFTIFASCVALLVLILGAFALYNHRVGRREIEALIRETREQSARRGGIDERVR